MRLFRLLADEWGFTSVGFMLMLLVLVVAAGAISADLWHLVAEHRELAGVVDGAAISAANAVDTEALREDPPVVRLLPHQAISRACGYLQVRAGVTGCPGPDASVVVDGASVSVTLRRPVELTLLRILEGLNSDADTSPIEVYVSSTARVATR